MKERIFFISPLPEDEEEEKFPYDKQGNTTVMAYYDERGNTIDTDYQKQPEPETTTENRIIIIYEAPKPKVITQENYISETIPTTPITEESQAANLYQQSENYIDRTPVPYYARLIAWSRGQSLEDYLTGKERPDPHARLMEFFSVQSPTEENQLTSIRSELAALTPVTGAPGAQPGE